MVILLPAITKRLARTIARVSTRALRDNMICRLRQRLLKHNFTAAASRQICTSDITYLATGEGCVYLAVIIDLFSRQVVVWQMRPHIKAEVVTNVLRMVWFCRRRDTGAIVRSDSGSQYCSGLFQNALKAYGMRSLMSRRGGC